MTRGKIAKIKNELISLYWEMDDTDLTFDNIKKSLELLEHCSICLSQEGDARLKGPTCSALDRKLNIPTQDHGPFNPNNSFRRSSATYLTYISGPHFFSITLFLAIPLSSINLEGDPPIPSTVSNFPALFQDSSATFSKSPGPFCPGAQVQETIFIRFSRIQNSFSYYLLSTSRMILLLEAWGIRETEGRVVGFCPTPRSFIRQKPIALLDFLGNPKNTFENRGVHKCKIVWNFV